MDVNPTHSTIAIVEDDFATREMYRRELEENFFVLPCKTMEEVLNILDHKKVDLIVFEPCFSEKRKLELIQRIKANQFYKNIPIVLISSQEISDKNLRNECAVCLVKPVLPAKLLLIIQDILLAN